MGEEKCKIEAWLSVSRFLSGEEDGTILPSKQPHGHANVLVLELSAHKGEAAKISSLAPLTTLATRQAGF